jgi:NAD(P)H-nitrite reductase large subunit
VIIGNGIAGISTARHLRKLTSDRITVISDESPYFFSRTALMYIFMGHMRFEDTVVFESSFWKKNRIELVHDRVSTLLPKKKKLALKSGETILYDRLVIATGSKPRKLGIPGEELQGVHSLYHLQDLQRIENAIKGKQKAAIIGGGLIGTEMAEMLRSRGMEVQFIIMEDCFWPYGLGAEQSAIIERHLERDHDIHWIKGVTALEISADVNGNSHRLLTSDHAWTDAHFVGIAVGVQPNISFLHGSGIEMNEGILVDRYFSTNLEDVYAVGDCAEQRAPRLGRQGIEAIWYTARMQGENLAINLSGRKRGYNPGRWFNSAKFFDIEFQEYGRRRPRTELGERELEWTDGDRRSMRLVFRSEDHVLLGISTTDVRLRHVVIDKWLRNAMPIAFMLKHLNDLIFEPEFSKNLTRDIQEFVGEALNIEWRSKRFEWKRIRMAKDYWR